VLVGLGAYVYWQHSRKQPAAFAAVGKEGARRDRGAQPAAPTPVLATRVHRGAIAVYFDGLGVVTPLNTVTVKSRVDGQLMEVRYREGDLVHKGDVLLQIDPRPYQVQLEQAEGQLMRDQAALENARIDLTRYQTLLPQNAIPEQQVATQKATIAQDQGIVRSADPYLGAYLGQHAPH
jgi:multidrug efflux system membrane fusion protein